MEHRSPLSCRRTGLVLGSLLCGSLAVLAPAAAAPAQAGSGSREKAAKLARHPYLQLATPASIVIAWRTRGRSRPVVRYGSRPTRLSHRVAATQIIERLPPVKAGAAARDGKPHLHSAPDGIYQYEARITGLTADRRYYYAVHDGGDLLAGADEQHRFRTLPVAGTQRAMRFWVVGDSGTGGPAQRAVFDAARKFFAAGKRELDAFLHVGDMAYHRGKDREFQDNFFAIYTSLLRHTVCWPAMGNHEGATSRGTTGVGPYYDAYVLPTRGEAGGLASGREAFYSFDFGQVHFVCLNSHDVSRQPDGEMALWLRSDLERTKARWLVAFWHHPPYTLGTHDSNREFQLAEMRTHIMPILESSGVDIVFTGHSHIYERSMLVDGAYATPTTAKGVILDDGDGDPEGDGPYRKSAGLQPNRGTVQVVTGHGGAGIGRQGTMPIMRRILVEHGSTVIDIDKDTLTGTMLNSTGVVRDRFRLVKRGDVPRRVVPFPWHADGPEILALADEFSESVEVTIRPRPAAPDAKVHFTLDGSEPTLRSPVYRGPLTLSGNTVVKALSTWRRGKRVSPVASREFERLPRGVVMRRILASTDDLEEGKDGKVDAVGRRLELGQVANRRQTVGLRFTHVDLPRGAKIKRAFVQFTCRVPAKKPAKLQVHVPVRPDAAPFGREPRSLSARTADAPKLDWRAGPWKAIAESGPAQQTPDLARFLQRIVDHPDWKNGNAVAVLVTGSGTRTAVAFDRMPRFAPLLYVEFAPK